MHTVSEQFVNMFGEKEMNLIGTFETLTECQEFISKCRLRDKQVSKFHNYLLVVYVIDAKY